MGHMCGIFDPKISRGSLRMAGAGKVVCVTGASGFIASWLVNLLLRRGYTVKATLRDPADPRRTGHLRSLEGATERLHLFRANLVEEGSFDAAIDGCDCVFHTASPVLLGEVNDPQAELLDPAVKGTLNVLNSSSKTSTVKRVIVTSSIAAVLCNAKPLSSDVIVDETWFSDTNFYEQSKAWYPLSKTLAEEAAWKFAKEHSLDLITINPCFVIGPLLQPTLNAGNEAILKLINGSSTFPNLSFGWVDVKDVCEAHILAYENPSASGRYCLAERVLHYSDVVKLIKEIYPSIQVPHKTADDNPFPPNIKISQEKAKGLGINFTPFEESLKETIESLKEKGFVSL
ncbi:Cinnamoyl-CoA reductase 1 [Platanthera zijinensis]|uniref:Cinnamoyl-CoA reductase 1 n=1 Tax=Platanthera zijinensis TaxID=2320716 RepID=A0AAP0BQS7_9ASPA